DPAGRDQSLLRRARGNARARAEQAGARDQCAYVLARAAQQRHPRSDRRLRPPARGTLMSHTKALRRTLARGHCVRAPGVYDGLSALLAEQAGFEMGFVSGACIAFARHGRPDMGLVSMSEVAETVALLRERVALPLSVDIDTGFGNALNVQRTVRVFER